MQQNFYKTDLGIVVKDNDSIRLKTCFTRQVLSEEDFNNSNPVRINRNKYLEELNIFFRNTKHEWEHDGTKFRKLQNFEINKHGLFIDGYSSSLKEIPRHNIEDALIGSSFIVLYHGRLFYTFMSGNYYPQMQLIDFHTKKLTSKWTNIKNLAPVFNKDTKQII